MSSTDMSAILLVSKFAAPPVALSSTLWGLKGKKSKFRCHFQTHTNKDAQKSTTWNFKELYHPLFNLMLLKLLLLLICETQEVL